MRHHLWHVLARGWRRAWRRAFGRTTSMKRGDEGNLRNTSRARFWAELREGQREAEARSARQRR
ncbi:MAG: hypothetical protein ACREQL_04270 [Candidatus Binatia bacterium]